MNSRALLVTAILVLGAQPASAQRYAKLITRIDSLAEATLRQSQSPGLSMAVSRGKETIVAKGYGAATEHTVYPIASITKLFTAAAVLRLVEQKRLKLADPAARYLTPGVEPDDPVTIKHLLNHISGIRPITGLDGSTMFEAMVDKDSVVEYFRSVPAAFRPATHFAYSNTGYYLLGLVIERVAGMPYRKFLRDSVLHPLKLDATDECTREPLPIPAFSAGGLCSNVLDLAAWGRALEARRALNNLSWHQMIEPAELKDGSRASYGFGVTLGQLEKHAFVSHGGATPGFSSYLGIYPDVQVVVAILASGGEALTRRLADQVARAVLGIPEPKVKDLALPPAAAGLYGGTYRIEGDSARISVGVREGRLVAQFDGGTPLGLLFQGGHEFASEADPATRFFFRPKGGEASAFDLVTGELRATAHIIDQQ